MCRPAMHAFEPYMGEPTTTAPWTHLVMWHETSCAFGHRARIARPVKDQKKAKSRPLQ